MKSTILIMTLAVCAQFTLPTPSLAEISDADATALFGVCPGENCVETVVDLSKSWNVSVETNSDLGTLVAILLEIAQQAEGSSDGTISDAMDFLAGQSSEPVQQQTIISASQVVREGNASQFNFAEPFAASPSNFRFPRRPWRRFQLNGNRPPNGNPRFGFGRFVRTMFGWARGNGRP